MEKPEALAEDAKWDPENAVTVQLSGRTEAGDWKWCVHCRRAYRAGWYREDEDGQHLCPFPDCGGDAMMDAMEYRMEEEPEVGEKVM